MALTEILESDLARYTGALLAVGAIYVSRPIAVTNVY